VKYQKDKKSTHQRWKTVVW